MKYFILFVTLLTATFFAHPLLAGSVIDRIHSSQTLVVGTPGDSPPFSVTTSSGKLIGMDIDIVKNLAAMMKVNIRFERMEFAKLIPALQEGKIDLAVSGITMSPERNMQVAFIGPYAVSGQSLLGKRSLMEGITDLKQLGDARLKIAALKGTTSEAIADKIPKATITRTDTLDQSLMLLLAGKVDALLADYPFCKVTEFRYPDRGIVMFDKPLTFEPLGIAVAGDDALFINLLTNYLSIMTGSGTLKQLQNYWFKSNKWIKNLPDVEFFKDMERVD
ncbi:MAG: transporter substrate-binding domain-containing protein [Desulfobulbaceae bacterium]|nr:transporter substrate-binding domain-containing protein [Desulfobulbaceae bacterium]